MEGKNAQKLISIFEIPINDYEIDMKDESPKEKKNEILDLFTNHNQLKSEAEFKDIEFNLHYACKEGDFELIKILLSETIQNDSNDLTFKIDKTNQTASLIKVDQNLENLIVPRMVKHEMKDYLVTSILSFDCSYDNQLKLKSVKFEENSSVSTIYWHALSYSNIEEIYFPKSLIELKEGWCYETINLKKITISPLNDQFIFKDDKYLLGKSDRNNEEFDILLFVRRDIKEISIPPNIKIIGSFSFEYSIIEEISIPANVTKICESAFCFCSNLRKIEIPTNSNLQIIENYAFSFSAIKEIYFPKSLIELKEGWCNETTKLTKITISPSNEQFIFKDDKYLLGKSDRNNDKFDILLLVRRDIKEISIPPNLTKICECAFCFCSNLRKVEIPTNSNLKTIEKNAFSNSSIEEICIPPSLTKICECAFSDCFKLRKVEIPTNSNLQTIEREAFAYSRIEEICIPPSLTKICKRAFFNCSKIRKVEISTNSNLHTIEREAFAYSNIEEICIPPSLTNICENAFCKCYAFQIIEIPEESKLQSIPKSAFKDCPKLKIMIPLALKKLIQQINNT